MHSVSVIIPTYNKAPFLELTLASYLHQTYPNFELVVVDDGSTDATGEVVEQYRGRLNLTYVRQPNRGRSAARNRAIRSAAGDLIVFSDDDRLVTPGFLAAHARAFSSPRDYLMVLGAQASIWTRWQPGQELESRVAPLISRRPELAQVLTRPEPVQLVSAGDIRERFAETLEHYSLEEPWWEHCKRVIAEFSGDLNRFRIGWSLATTGNMSMSRKRAVDIGLFDESFSRWGIEDTEFSFRLWHDGARVEVSPEALSYHQLHGKSPTWFEEWSNNFMRFWDKFDLLELPLCYFYARRKLTCHQVNAILSDCDALEREGKRAMVDELKRVYRLAVQGPPPSP